MQVDGIEHQSATQFAEFDRGGVLIAASPGFCSDWNAAERYLEQFVDLAGSTGPGRAGEALSAWRTPGAAITAHRADGTAMLLTSAPTAAGGVTLSATPLQAPAMAEHLLRRLVDDHPLPVWVNEVDTGRILFGNAKVRALFEVEDENPGDSTVAEFLVHDSESLRIMNDLNENGEAEHFVLRARTAKGREFWINGAVKLFDHDGRKLAFSIIQDATGLKAHEGEIARTRHLLADAISSLSEAFALFDEDHRLVICNQKYRDMNGPAAALIEPGVHWETLLRQLARSGLVRRAVGREAAWIAESMERAENFESFEIEHTDGRVRVGAFHPTTLGGFIITQTDLTARRTAEKAAKDSEQVLSKILEASPAALCMSRIGDGEVIYRSPACSDLFGEEANARDQFADPLDRADFLTELLPAGRIDEFNAPGRRHDGVTFPALFSARIIDYRGEDVMVSSVIDLTDQLRARDELANANQRMRDAIEALDEGFALYDDQDRLIMWNQRYVELNAHIAGSVRSGVTYGELLDDAIATGRLGPEDVEKTRESGERDIENRVRRYEFQHNDGTWFSVSRNPTSDGGFVITRLDITERKRAEEAQREADELLRRVLDACPVNLLMCRYDTGEVVYTSNYTAETFGKRKWVSDYWTDRQAGLQMTADIQAHGGSDYRAFALKDIDDKPIQVALSSRKIEFRGEDMIVSHAFDLTERLAMEAELTRQQAMLHQSEKLSALGELLAGVAHELNNPLSVVVGHALMLEEEAEDPDQVARIQKISSAAERCSRIVKTFLAMARERPAKLERTDVNQVIETAIDVAAYGLRNAGAELRLDLAPDLPAVMADVDQLAQVFANLIVNAEHVLTEKGRDGWLAIRTQAQPSGTIRIVFEDNGPGIPKSIRSRIFEPFFTTKAVDQGTGIGLAFCHRVITTHEGTITAGVGSSGGAEFAITLNTAPAPAAVEEQPSPPTASARGRVLVIDDEPDVLDLIARILRRDGYEVETVSSAEEALSHLPGPFDLIFSDLNMPGMGGRAFLDRLRRDWPELAGRLSFVTGDTMSPNAEAFLQGAGRPYLEKPIHPADLRRIAAEVIGAE
ncbi:MAG: PAS-domain containing protein [Pseudomonadota bacterium]